MGEAKARGTQEQRAAKSKEEQAARDVAAENRAHAKGLVWLAFETTTSQVLISDLTGEVILDDDGDPRYGPDQDGWKLVRPVDVPEYLQQDGVVARLKDGEEISWLPHEDGAMWYRGVICSEPEEHKKELH